LEAIMQPPASSRNRGRIVERERERESEPKSNINYYYYYHYSVSEQKTSSLVLWKTNRLEKERERESSDDFEIFCNFMGFHSFLPSFRVPWKQAPDDDDDYDDVSFFVFLF
jgi:hypothetical protein